MQHSKSFVLSSRAEDGAVSRKTFRPAQLGIIEHYNQEASDMPTVLFQAALVTFEGGVLSLGDARPSRGLAELDLMERLQR